MKLEVEQKHRVVDGAALERCLAERGAMLGPPIEQVDEYFNHPSRDFVQTDEALRIRLCGDERFVTYKGPKLDADTKTRHELELPLAASHGEFAELLAALGFRSVAIVRKSRRSFEFVLEGQKLQGAWDEVDGVGTFVELELMAEEPQLDEAKRLVATAARGLNLGPSIRQSYLELLLSNQP